MRLIKRIALALALILSLMTVPVVADDGGMFTEQPIPKDVNSAFLITECGKALLIGVAIFEGPADKKGKLLIAIRPAGASESEGDRQMAQILAQVVLEFKADGTVIELADITDRFCA